MRVLIAHNRYRLGGGEERCVALLEEGLTAAGLSVARFERDSAELEHSMLRTGLAAATLPYRPGGGGIGRAVRDFRPTVVHFHNVWPLLTLSALRAVRRYGATVVMTAHNYRFACPAGTLLRAGRVHDDCIQGSSLKCGLRGARSNRLESTLYGLALTIQRRVRMLERWVDAFVAPSAFMQAMLARSGQPSDRVHVIPHGVPIPDSPGSGSRDRALFAGRLSAEKGLHTLLEAARMAPDVPLSIAGSGPLAEEIAAAAPPNVSYVGSLDRPSLQRALTDAAFLIVPSEWYENLPYSALEACAAGRPVIATRMGGLPEIVEHERNGLLVDSRRPDQLAAAMNRLWGDPGLVQRLGDAARTRARERFEIHRQTDHLIELYERVSRERS